MKSGISRHYVDGPYGQVHRRDNQAVSDAMPLVCLHATAYSSQSFLPLMRACEDRARLIAFDAPGYGESDAPDAPIAMADYADAMAAAVRQVIPEGPVALLGYHTGAYIATEMAIRHPDLVDRLALIGVPYFQALDLDVWRDRLVVKHRLGDDLHQFDERWDYFITRRDPSVSLARGFANFVDELKAWPNGWWAHEAMFAYDSDARLPLVRQRSIVINPVGHLAEPSRIAAALMSDCSIVELPDVSGPVLEMAPDRMAAALLPFLGLI